MKSAQFALADPSLEMTRDERRRFAALERDVAAQARREVGRTRAVQQAVLDYAASGRIAGFSGLTVDLDRDIALVHAHALALERESPDYATASYLLSALVAMRTGGTNQATIAALGRVPRG